MGTGRKRRLAAPARLPLSGICRDLIRPHRRHLAHQNIVAADLPDATMRLHVSTRAR
tara:strand:- start:4875 stop:5045 length:171 start_codon:yes stop_codon:yes gene_type:complete